MLPASLLVLERGWLSSNNVVCLEGDEAALIDSGYVTHAAQTVALLERALDGRRLTRLLNTHSHSDHIGGNAAVSKAFACQVIVPVGIDATIAEWDEEALLLSPLGQSAARFRHDATIAGGDEIELGGLNWHSIAVPGHDMDALAFHNAERRILISGDALWRDGFGVIFPNCSAIRMTPAASRRRAKRSTGWPVCRLTSSFPAMARPSLKSRTPSRALINGSPPSNKVSNGWHVMRSR